MSSGANRCRIDLGCEEERGRVRIELDPERREEVDELEGVTSGAFLVERGEDASGDDERDERHYEANSLHTLPAVGLMVEE